MNKIRILHFVRDDKFVDGTLKLFENDDRFVNEAIMKVDAPDYRIRLITNTDKIKLISNKRELKSKLGGDGYDAVFFYSLTDYRVFKYIPKDKIVMWWAWGYDIYGPNRFIDIPLFKPLTQKYIKQINSSLWSRVKVFVNNLSIIQILRTGNRFEAIKRIDYFQPVIHIEYELMKMIPGFKAKEFYYPKAHGFKTIVESDIPYHGNNIIINHSATFTCNHLDVWEDVKNYIPADARVYLPINYGRKEYADFLTKDIKSCNNNLFFLKDFMPRDEYFSIVDTCSYAVFGVLREAAMGSIFHCLAMGVKIFLYKDSLVYKYFSELGCIIYSIEDINEKSFRTPLSEEQARINRICLLKECSYVTEVSETAIAELLSIVEKN